jgi:hypothetical protein
MKLLTWNVAMLPRWFGGNRENAARCEEIAAAIREIAPDVVVLQEVFDRSICKRLSAALSPSFSAIIASRGGGWPFAPSGLFLATNRPILQDAFEPFPDVDRWTTDWFARKGVLGAEIEGCGWIFATHLQAGTGARHGIRGFRARQVVTLCRFITQRAESWALGGDFNLIAEIDGVPTEEWRSFENTLPSVDGWRAVHPNDPGFTWDGLRNPRVKPQHRTRERLDGWRFRGWRPTEASLVNRPLSDHYGVLLVADPP